MSEIDSMDMLGFLGVRAWNAQKRIVSIHDEIVQRQPGFVMSVCAAFVGNSLRTPVVWVCTAMSASAMSCISLSTG